MTPTITAGSLDTMAETTTPFTEQLARYRAGDLELGEFATWIANHEWKPYDLGPALDGITKDFPPGPQPGTFDEVMRARRAGLLTAEEYAVIHDTRQARDPSLT